MKPDIKYIDIKYITLECQHWCDYGANFCFITTKEIDMDKAKICPACGGKVKVTIYRRISTPNFIIEPLSPHEFESGDYYKSTGQYLLSIESPDKKTIHRLSEPMSLESIYQIISTDVRSLKLNFKLTKEQSYSGEFMDYFTPVFYDLLLDHCMNKNLLPFPKEKTPHSFNYHQFAEDNMPGPLKRYYLECDEHKWHVVLDETKKTENDFICPVCNKKAVIQKKETPLKKAVTILEPLTFYNESENVLHNNLGSGNYFLTIVSGDGRFQMKIDPWRGTGHDGDFETIFYKEFHEFKDENNEKYQRFTRPAILPWEEGWELYSHYSLDLKNNYVKQRLFKD